MPLDIKLMIPKIFNQTLFYYFLVLLVQLFYFLFPFVFNVQRQSIYAEVEVEKEHTIPFHTNWASSRVE